MLDNIPQEIMLKIYRYFLNIEDILAILSVSSILWRRDRWVLDAYRVIPKTIFGVQYNANNFPINRDFLFQECCANGREDEVRWFIQNFSVMLDKGLNAFISRSHGHGISIGKLLCEKGAKFDVKKFTARFSSPLDTIEDPEIATWVNDNHYKFTDGDFIFGDGQPLISVSKKSNIDMLEWLLKNFDYIKECETNHYLDFWPMMQVLRFSNNNLDVYKLVHKLCGGIRRLWLIRATRYEYTVFDIMMDNPKLVKWSVEQGIITARAALNSIEIPEKGKLEEIHARLIQWLISRVGNTTEEQRHMYQRFFHGL